jgi:hypothetical protein
MATLQLALQSQGDINLSGLKKEERTKKLLEKGEGCYIWGGAEGL